MKAKRLAIIDEHEMFRRGIVASLARDPGLDILMEADEGPLPPTLDIAVLSPRAFRTLSPLCPSVICGGWDDQSVRTGVRGAAAVVDRDTVRSEQIVATVRTLAGLRRDRHPTSPAPPATGRLDARSQQVLQLLAEGADTREISRHLHYSERTIKLLIRGVQEALNARTRAHAVARAIRVGII